MATRLHLHWTRYSDAFSAMTPDGRFFLSVDFLSKAKPPYWCWSIKCRSGGEIMATGRAAPFGGSLECLQAAETKLTELTKARDAFEAT